MRIGTWNLDARWSDHHRALIEQVNCDVWLLTEISSSFAVDGYDLHFSTTRMSRGQHYAGILSSLPIQRLPDPHPASAMAVIGAMTFCSSILPWAGCGIHPESPWIHGKRLEEQMATTIDALMGTLPSNDLIWGGDWNQNLEGGWQHVGCNGGRTRLGATVEELGLDVVTKALPHRINGSTTIDHIALPRSWKVCQAERVDATGLSDHDAYFVEAEVTHR